MDFEFACFSSNTAHVATRSSINYTTLPQHTLDNMAQKGGAYDTKAADTDFRKKWDKEEYAERAKKKDQEERERMQENEERLKQGRRCKLVH